MSELEIINCDMCGKHICLGYVPDEDDTNFVCFECEIKKLEEKAKEAKIIQMRVDCGKSKEGHSWKISYQQKIVNEWINDGSKMMDMPILNGGMGYNPPPSPSHACVKCNHTKGKIDYTSVTDDDPPAQHSMENVKHE